MRLLKSGVGCYKRFVKESATAECTAYQPIVTVQQHFLREQQRFPDPDPTFPWLLSGITLATKMVQSKIQRAGLADVLGATDSSNVQGEQQQKLDIYANKCLLHCLGLRESVAALISEENEEPVTFDRAPSCTKYIVVFDPLDGSSNIDVNVCVGTIFSILRRPDSVADTMAAVLQPGWKQVAAGYVVYGPSTMFVYTAGHGVYGFTLDPAIGAYLLSHENIRMPEVGTFYSVNQGNSPDFSPPYAAFLEHLRSGKLGHRYGLRYIGSLVADFHRMLLKGGIFLYPGTRAHPGGKLRLLYEANPLAFIAEQAGGGAIDGERRILDIQPDDIHQRTPLVIAGKSELEAFQNFRG
jgi:fructose-1,6-bisphosphatase I